jgi:hypothetical protein
VLQAWRRDPWPRSGRNGERFAVMVAMRDPRFARTDVASDPIVGTTLASIPASRTETIFGRIDPTVRTSGMPNEKRARMSVIPEMSVVNGLATAMIAHRLGSGDRSTGR